MAAFGARLVEMHSQDGMPLELSLEMAAERGLRPALLGILIGAARHKLSRRMVCEVVAKWAKLFGPPSPGESGAIRQLLKE